MSIEVILKDHVDHLGRRGEVVRVASGYARNFLFPRKLALAVTDENKRQIERERAKADAKDADEMREAQAFQARLESAEIVIARRVGENQTLYGSVTTSDIAEALALRQIEIDRRKIHLPDPLKTLGDHKVAVKLHRELSAELTVKIVPAS
ncbi:MAG: 50S ribosomal protein L9 [Vicinamibacterales bacterium]